jgi:hypothetical protein
VHCSAVGPSLEEGGSAVPGQDLESATLGRTPRCYLVFLWLLSALTFICAQSSREVHRAPTSDGIPGGQPNRLHKRSIARSGDYVTVYTDLI